MRSRMGTYAGFISHEAFPRAARYPAPREIASGQVRDGPRPAPSEGFTERHLQCVWYDSDLRPASLITNRGEPVLVEDPGIWNLETGPDFRGGAILIGQERRRLAGDVEIHIRPGDWEAHGHARDPHYQGVRVHVTYYPGVPAADLFPPGTIHIALKDSLAANAWFSFDSIDTLSYPMAARATVPPCGRMLASWPFAERIALLESAGQERMRRKAERMAAAIHERGPEQVLYEEILCALGYKENKVPFRRLAEHLTWQILQEESLGDPSRATALLLGVSGLLPGDVRKKWDPETRDYVRTLWNTWWKAQERLAPILMPRSCWTLSGIRPANHPARRMAAAACLCTNNTALSHRILEAARTLDLRAMAQIFRACSDPYWDHRLSLSGKKHASAVALIGDARANEIATNVLIPFLAASGNKDQTLSVYMSQMPSETLNSIARQTALSLFGRDQNLSVFKSGLCRQGLVQIFSDYCLNDRSRCAQCPLPRLLTDYRPDLTQAAP